MPAKMTTEPIPVKINVKTMIDHGDHTETYELTAFGRYQQTATASFLRYEEAMEVGPVNTMIKMAENEVLILRNGAVKMRMVFRKGLAVSGTYHSPHGLMEIITEAKSIDHSHNKETNEGMINLHYDLSMQATLAGTYHLEIKYEEERK
ncbi:DUF1934 domain-containing protein [Neobacillus sp. LXY-4]|uniref:DUF1934 domain-containing protein n=1 Tax=Neobacillus sp. LXY-4 TaxID=3379826 RepID=UPI003EDFA600